MAKLGKTHKKVLIKLPGHVQLIQPLDEKPWPSTFGSLQTSRRQSFHLETTPPALVCASISWETLHELLYPTLEASLSNQATTG